jgi:hypothetical protein
MLQIQEGQGLPTDGRTPEDWIRLIRKLRWVGLEEEAWRLQQAVSMLPADERAGVVTEPLGTD